MVVRNNGNRREKQQIHGLTGRLVRALKHECNEPFPFVFLKAVNVTEILLIELLCKFVCCIVCLSKLLGPTVLNCLAVTECNC